MGAGFYPMPNVSERFVLIGILPLFTLRRMAAEQEKSGVSFGFSKKSETKGLKIVDGAGSHISKDELGFATAFETEEINR